jgi:hypothetical protein
MAATQLVTAQAGLDAAEWVDRLGHRMSMAPVYPSEIAVLVPD